MNVLFLCSKNQWRSPTAERVFRRIDGLSVRSAGTASSARRVVSALDVAWADVIFAMETKHLERLRADFRQALRDKVVHVLEIPDDYRFMDPELVVLLEERVGAVLAEMQIDDDDDSTPGVG